MAFIVINPPSLHAPHCNTHIHVWSTAKHEIIAIVGNKPGNRQLKVTAVPYIFHCWKGKTTNHNETEEHRRDEVVSASDNEFQGNCDHHFSLY